MDSKPANHGKQWTPEQDEWLLNIVLKKGAAYCAKRMERTKGGVVAHLKVLAHRMVADGMSVQQACERVGISEKELIDFISDKKKKEEEKAVVLELEQAPPPPSMQPKFVEELKQLNERQAAVLSAVEHGTNVFFTGPAGTGKTETIKHIVAYACQFGKSIGVTATTGCASFLIRGKTVHSFLGIGLANKSAKDLVYRARKFTPKVVEKLEALDMLVIDEISMMDAETFDKCSDYMKIIRKDPRPFGGVQLAVSGDFCQLPPVQGKYVFHSAVWEAMAIDKIMLEQVFRQTDTLFIDLLTRSRWAQNTKEDIERLRACADTVFPAEFQPTLLYAYRNQVADMNEREYKKLRAHVGAEIIYKTSVSNKLAQSHAEKLLIPQEMALCIGAQVMVTWNIDLDNGIINGTRGVVRCLSETCVTIKTINETLVQISFIEVSPDEENPKIKIRYMPLKLAYAITIHKSQGVTLDCAELDLGKSIFEYGQAYTALSRVKNLSSVRISSVHESAFKTHPDVKTFYKS